MVVGIIGWELEMIGCQSLKEKRRVLKSLKDRLHNRFNVSVAETGHQDLWQRAELTASFVAGEAGQADAILEQLDRFVASEYRTRIIRTQRRFA